MSEAVKGLLVKCCAYNALGTSCETILLSSPGTQQSLLKQPPSGIPYWKLGPVFGFYLGV